VNREAERVQRMFSLPATLRVVVGLLCLMLLYGGWVNGDSSAGATSQSDVAGSATRGKATAPKGSLGLYFSQPIASLDPHKCPVLVNCYVYQFPVFDRLISIDNKGELIPMLATRWEFTNGGRTLDLQLRPDVAFHSGNPMNANAVKASIERAQRLQGSTQAQSLRNVTSVDVVDDRNLRLQLGQPDASVPALLATAAGVVMDPAVFNDPRVDMNTNPSMAGSGPWTVTAFEPNVSASYDHIAGKYWESGAGRLKSIKITYASDQSARTNAVQTGVAQMAFVNNGQTGTVEPLTTQGKYALYREPSYITVALWWNDKRAGFDDALVRQAIKQGINKNEIANGLLNGDCVVDNGVYPKASWAGQQFKDPHPYNPKAARAALREAGATDLSFRLKTLAGTASNDVAVAIQAQLAEVGIDVQIDAIPSAQVFQAFTSHDYDAFLSAFVNGPDPNDVLRTSLIDGFNFLGGLGEKYRSQQQQGINPSLDQNARAKIYSTMSQSMAEDLAIAPICVTTTNWLADAKVKGIGEMPPIALLDFRYLSIGK
jgi:peptide/nickel transport system substrate-binding protein